MLIQCPICSTSIEVTNDQIGHKGRCQKCESKFIIPEDPDAEFEILEHGEAPEEASRSKPALKLPAKGAPVRAGLRFRSSKAKQSSAGFLLAIIGIGVAMAFGFKAIAAFRDGSSTKKPAAVVAANPTPDKIAIGQPVVSKATPAPGKLDLAPAVKSPQPADLPPVAAAEPEPAPPGEKEPNKLSEEKKARALAFIKSEQESKRCGAYAAMRKLGDDWKHAYGELLGEARAFYLAKLGDKAFDVSVGSNSLTDFEDDYDGWKASADAARQKVQTDWKTAAPKDYKAKHAEMDAAFDATASLYGSMLKAAKGAGDRELAMLQSTADILFEIDSELAWCAGEATSERAPMRDLISEAGGADDFVQLLDLLGAARDAADACSAVAAHNSRLNWATPPYQSFATLLNERRAVLGLGTLRLEEKLSNSCRAHSADMAAKGYFSHTGADGSSFVARAKRAGFAGGPSGECIFMGSSAAHAAHQAWWYSDGHRLIMYAGGPNTLGLGAASNHWTLNTARYRW